MKNKPLNNQDAWWDAAEKGDTPTLQRLLVSGMDINSTDTKKNTALHLATKHAQLETIAFLIEHQANLDLQNDYDSTPLHLTEKNISSIRLLLEAGANPNIKDKDWDYPYYFAFYGSMVPELTKLYIKYGAHLVFHEKT